MNDYGCFRNVFRNPTGGQWIGKGWNCRLVAILHARQQQEKTGARCVYHIRIRPKVLTADIE